MKLRSKGTGRIAVPLHLFARHFRLSVVTDSGRLTETADKGVVVRTNGKSLDGQSCYELYERFWRGGDALAIEIIDRRLRPAARSFLARIFGQSPANDDVIQDVWVALLSRHSHIWNECFEAFFFQSLRYRAISRLRAELRHGRVLTVGLEDDDTAAFRRALGERSLEETATTNLYIEHQMARCTRLLEERNPDWLKAFQLWFAGLDYGEIATVLGQRRDCVQQWMHRTFRYLRERMGTTKTGEMA